MVWCRFFCSILLTFSWIGGCAQYSSCDGNTSLIGDGYCDLTNNNIECDYDGGDCCECTCSRDLLYPCGFHGFDCLDPSASNATSECQNTAIHTSACSTEYAIYNWIVNDTASARALAEAVNCTGGTFNVTWKGKVIIDRTFYIAEGTTLHLTGADLESEASGGGSIRIFTLVNANLHVVRMVLSNGNATYGGAISAARSKITLNASTFYCNVASSTAGALYLDGSSLFAMDGQASFLGNSAGSFGGAIASVRGSNISFSSRTSFFNNSAFLGGGAAYIGHDSTVCWSAEMSFARNSANINTGAGGAIIVDDGSNVSWSAETSFVDNIGGSGGALFVYGGSVVSWSAKTSFISNSGDFGGAVFIYASSSISWTAESSFTKNSAFSGDGGAMFVVNGSNVWWEGVTSFIGNTADGAGGALFIAERSGISWSAETFFINNTAGGSGGTILVYYESSIFWSAKTAFVNNSGMSGGAVYITGASSVSWTAESSFTNNNAVSADGGAMFVDDGSILWWGGVTSFIGNTANWTGGVFYVDGNSDLSWSAETFFLHNTAKYSGGALFVHSCGLSWSAETSFSHNVADISGGAMFLYNSDVSWSAETFFNSNIAGLHGGAIVVGNESSTSWEAPTTFFNNTALSYSGGAVLVSRNSRISWETMTSFLSNTAIKSGGGLASLMGSSVTMEGRTLFSDNVAGTDGGGAYIYRSDDQKQFLLAIHNTTVFHRNSCGANGGGMALIGSVSTELATANMTFDENVAGIAGGAVYLSGVVFGPTFVGTRFVSNSADTGGGVYTIGSGIAEVSDTLGVPEPQDPFTFISCEFIGNDASTRGGALDSGAGIDLLVNTTFVGNTAGSGGALRLAGETSLDGCDFNENISDEDLGPAVYNEGFIPSLSDCRFVENVFSCEPNYFFAYDGADVGFDTVCKDCDSQCEDCDFEGKEPTCVEVFEHTSSPGGNTTLEFLLVERGYWRASNTSTKVLICYNEDACRGGVTGAQDYCLDGYEGPYCSVCSDGYTPSIGSSCKRCPDTSSLGFALLAVLLVVVFAGFVAFLSYMLSGKKQSADRGIVARISRFVPLHSLKIVVVVWQIVTQFCNVANFAFPDIYREFLDGVGFMTFDFSWIISTRCIAYIDFHDRLLISTLGPIIGMIILGATYAMAIYRHRGSEEACSLIRNKHLSMVLLLTFLVYSSVSTAVFEMFVCDDLDDGRSYLRADYRIECDSSKHKALEIYAGFMIVLYAIGIPAFYAFLLFSNRETLTKDPDRENNDGVTSFADLWKPYKPRYFFYEVVECCRRVLLTGVVVFIYPDSSAQIAVALVMANAFFMFSEALAPYVSAWDGLISRMGHAIVVTSMFLALLLKVDASKEQAKSQRAFEAVLVAANVVMVLVVIGEACAMVIAWSKEKVNEDHQPRSNHSLGCLSVADDIGSNAPDDEAPHFGRESTGGSSGH